MHAIIEIDGVTKYYGAHAAVSDLSFRISPGEVVGLLGLNGAGKTTTLRILSGLLVPTSGRVTIAGIDMARDPEGVRSRIGFLPESPPLYSEMTVGAYLAFVAHIKGARGDVEHAIDETLTATDLHAVRHKVIRTLSFGFRKRVGIAQAIVNRPALLLLDEPSNGLDPIQIVHMRNVINGLRAHNTILVSSHILSEIHALCDRIFVLQDGRIAAEGSEEALAQKVAGDTKVRLEVRGDRRVLTAALDDDDHVTHHTIEREEDGVTFATVELRSDCREELAKLVVNAGLGLRRLERVRLQLEGIFLKLAGEDKQNPDAPNAAPQDTAPQDTAPQNTSPRREAQP